MKRSILLILCVLFFGVMVCELQAPEIAEADINGYYYQVRQDGSIRDSNGVIRGWVLGNRIYDNRWSLMYEMKDGKVKKSNG
jgi:hypothetical protein